MLRGRKTYFIIEEPESHLYPDTQKQMPEYISLSRQMGSSVLMTTHSPYVLGTINNQLYAHRISEKVDKGILERILDKKIWLNFDEFEAYHVNNGIMISCKDYKMKSIENEVIDGASEKINDDFDK